jgi:hypothetical protein
VDRIKEHFSEFWFFFFLHRRLVIKYHLVLSTRVNPMYCNKTEFRCSNVDVFCRQKKLIKSRFKVKPVATACCLIRAVHQKIL